MIRTPMMNKWLLRIAVILLIGAVGMLCFLWYSNHVIDQMREKIYSVENIPVRKVGLLLGAAKTTPNGVPNLYFAARITAAAELYHARKITHILISGDNSRKGYDEPNDMKAALLEQNIPAEAITLDFAGFRTLDSIVRAKVVFGCSKLTVITQPGHLERALYIAEKHDMDAIGYAAKEPDLQWLRQRNRKREIAARAAAWRRRQLFCTIGRRKNDHSRICQNETRQRLSSSTPFSFLQEKIRRFF